MTALDLAHNVLDDYACTTRELIIAVAPDGSEGPITKCAWFQIAPCGCCNGVTMAQHGDTLLLTADAAMVSMAGNQREAARDAKLGFRMVLVRMSDWREHLSTDVLTVKCPHDPKWGYHRPTRKVGAVTWTRLREDEWYAETVAGKWALHKMGRGFSWYLRKPGENGWGDYMDGRLADALKRAAPLVAEQPAAVSS